MLIAASFIALLAVVIYFSTEFLYPWDCVYFWIGLWLGL
jgi:hypothetical protein